MKFIDRKAFFIGVTSGDIELTDNEDATIYTSYKAGEQDFTLFGRSNTKANLHKDDIEAVIFLCTDKNIYTNRQIINRAFLFEGKKDMIKFVLRGIVEQTVDELC